LFSLVVEYLKKCHISNYSALVLANSESYALPETAYCCYGNKANSELPSTYVKQFICEFSKVSANKQNFFSSKAILKWRWLKGKFASKRLNWTTKNEPLKYKIFKSKIIHSENELERRTFNALLLGD